MPYIRPSSKPRKLPLFKNNGKYLPTLLAKIPQTALLAVLVFGLLFGGQVVDAVAADSSWNLIRKSDGLTACTVLVTHEGAPSLDEITAACGNEISSGWQNNEYTLLQITPTPAATSTPATPVPAKSWLDTPATVGGLHTNRPLTYLAGKLIAAGYVDVSACNGSALLVNGYASPCGLTAAMPYVYVWQNRFDEIILNAAAREQVPAFMFKNLLIQESQMWPQASKHVPPEYGIGQLTENGTDTLLMWNTPFFRQICDETLEQEKCKKDYLSITASERAFLRGATLIQVRADCYNCPSKIDLNVTEKSIPIFAAAVKANFRQVDQIVKNLTGKAAVSQMEWQEVWKLAAANYHAGPGCSSSAMRATLKDKKPLRWKYIKENYEEGCTSAVDYVEHIITTDTDVALPSASDVENATRIIYGLPAPTQTPTATLPFAATASSTPTIDPAWTATPTATVDPLLTPQLDPLDIDQSVSQQLESPHTLDEVVVKIDPRQRADAVNALNELGININQDAASVDSLNTLVLNIEPSQIGVVLNTLKNNNGVDFVEPNYLVEMAGTPNDPGFAQQDYLWDIQVPQTWDALPTMQEVLVAVIDSGVDTSHPDLINSVWQNPGEIGFDLSGLDKKTNDIDDDGNGYVDDWQGWNMVAGNNNVSDDQGHGTHLSGIIAAGMNDNVGIVGAAPNARILPVKILDNTGVGTYAQAAEGIVYATDMGARIINLGFGGTGSSDLLQNAIQYALNHNVLVVAAAGNSGNATTYYPAGYPGVLAVSAVAPDMSWATFSSSGQHISLSAPGLGIYSTLPGGTFGTFSGTSMSSAQVSGVAALLAGQPQFSDVYVLRAALLGSASDLGTPGQDPFYGYGVVHAFDALGYMGPVLPTPTPWIVPTSTTGGGVIAMASQDLWGAAQSSSGAYPITSPANSIDKAFNDLTASITGTFATTSANNWTFTAIDDTTLSAVVSAELDLRYYMTGWVNDSYYIQVFDNTNPSCLGGWCTVYTLQFVSAPPAGGPPSSTLTTLTIPVTSVLNTVSRVNAAQVRITGSNLTAGVADNITLYIDEVRLRILDAFPPTATPTSTPVFIPTATLPPSRWMTATPIAGEPHNHFAAAADECASCHRGHTAQGFGLRRSASEEQICFDCHQAGNPLITDVQTAFTSKSNTATRFFSHGVSSTSNIHLASESAGASFGLTNRHIECEDCHSPHTTARTDPSGSLSAPAIQQEMFGVSGVDAVWTASNQAGTLTFMPAAEREYQNCFKCHSSYTTQPTYRPDGYRAGTGYIPNGLFKLDNSTGSQVPDSRDLAREFNSYQVSFHPVAALGRNRSIPSGSFVSGWSVDSMVYCSDCHQNAVAPTNGKGPHGSPLLHLLDGSLAGSAEYITSTDPALSCAPGGCPSIHDSGELCFKCHQFNTYSSGSNSPATTNFRNGTENLHAFHAFGSCYTCHDSHGSEQDRLINFDTSIVTLGVGSTSQNSWQYDYATSTGTCFVACHDGDHGPDKSYTP